MLKKMIAATLVMTFVLMPVKDIVFHDQTQTVSAKGYRSGVKSFNSGGKSGGSSFFQNKGQQQNKQKSFFSKNNSYSAKAKKGGFMKGLIYGGIAGMLFGGLLGNMGAFGSFLGLMINIIAVLVIISLITRIFANLRNSRRRQDDRWNK
ncbi:MULTISPECIES: hypothetical protein [Fictibacillus]|uniref:Preprotein translocase subunit Tim44 n=1 Tax=Fictibacillus terranigra TaxID=3058424 RepID=A0ABT8EAU9_9BACL|nr:hypothetical protein [Fictibacillus sp. CENA-BCM004]MDN4075024.1 hypothetical protein [Fictibacillus sp. CENA-BCM004]